MCIFCRSCLSSVGSISIALHDTPIILSHFFVLPKLAFLPVQCYNNTKIKIKTRASMHKKPLDELLQEFKTSKDGLTTKEALFRLKKYGSNELKVKKKTPWWVHFLKEFTDLMVLILLFAAFIAGFAGEMRDAIVILFIVFVNAIIGFVQKYKAEKAIEALKKLVAPTARVIRDGKEQQVNAKNLVPGDVIILMEGDKITADARVIEENELETQEAALTGESMPVPKHADTQENLRTGEKSNIVYMGTDVVHGSGKAIVIHTGMDTKFGHIATLTTTTKKDKSPLQQELFRIGVFVGKITLAISAVLIATGYFIQGQAFADTFLFATSVAVAAVPEGLPATVTIALAMGVQRLARKQSIVRQLASVETLGSTTHICTDKTGTLTKNEMTVKEMYMDNYNIKISGAGYKPVGSLLIKGKDGRSHTIGDFDSNEEDFKKRTEKLKTLKKDVTPLYNGLEQISAISALCNNATLTSERVQHENKYTMLGDPTEGSLLTMIRKIGFSVDHFNTQYEKKYELSFDSTRKRMSVIEEEKSTGDYYMFTKGAPDEILEICSHILMNGRVIKLDNETKEKLKTRNEEMAKRALRVIGFSFKQIDKKQKYHAETDENDMVFVGMVGMIDPPRSDVKKAISMAKRAGIKVYTVTGDHGLTAEAIAKQIGLVSDNDKHRIITGREVETMSEKDIQKLFEHDKHGVIFARTAPEDKLKIVSALKKSGHIVAVTGDGVNDAPALKRADIGIAMGITGTDVSKEASNMVLADDSFSTIINAVKEGRTIYENLKKFIFYIFSCNIGELITVFSAIILGLPAPLTAILILSVDIGTDVLPALALGIDTPEKGIMSESPRDPKAKIMNKSFVGRFLYVGFFIGLIVVGAYFWSLFSQGWQWGQMLDHDSAMYIKSSTFAFAVLVLIQMVNAYNSRSSYQSVFSLGFLSNLYLMGAVCVSLGVVYLLVEVPFFQEWVHTTSLEWYEWMVIIGASFAILLVEELRKLVVRSSMKRKNAHA
ncbi:HAD-IC family P-type ATPase [Candidatus Peregrinibacteria bacterium]|nr:HAD-IC family P-type ATPase [Candidatus Peregrinibacteria bacterium]